MVRKRLTAPERPVATGLAIIDDASVGSWMADSVQLSYGNVRQILSACLGAFTPLERITIADTSYLTLPGTAVLQAIHSDPMLAPGAYRVDVFDCDDYVMYLKTRFAILAQRQGLTAPLALGFVLTIEHAFTIGIDSSGPYLVNTQSDTIPTTNDPTAFGAFMQVTNANIVQVVYI